MSDKLNELLNKLEESVGNDDFIDNSYDIIDEIEERDDAFDAVEPILRIIEKNPDADFGKPGPLVHFVERFYKMGYEEQLVESLKRCPTKYTLWMLNRIINDSKGDRKVYFINILNNIISNSNIDNEVLLLAKHFIELQNRV